MKEYKIDSGLIHTFKQIMVTLVLYIATYHKDMLIFNLILEAINFFKKP